MMWAYVTIKMKVNSRLLILIAVSLSSFLFSGAGLASGSSDAMPIPVDTAPVEKYVEEWRAIFNASDALAFPTVQQTADEGYIITAYVSPALRIIKVDPDGRVQWERSFDRLGQYGKCLPAADGGFIIGGSAALPTPGSWRVMLIKTDSSGSEIWEKVFPDFPAPGSYAGLSLLTAADGGYLVTGWTDQKDCELDALLVKFDSSGERVFVDIFPGKSGKDEIWSAQCTDDGGYIMTGNTASYGAGGDDVWLVKYNNGISWTKTFGGPDHDAGKWAIQTADGGYIVLADTRSSGSGGNDIWVIKTDAKGDRIWDRTFGGPHDDYAGSIIQTAEGRYMVIGSTELDESWSGRAWLMELDSSGKMVYEKTFGDAYSFGETIQQTVDGGYVISGESVSQNPAENAFWILKLKELRS